MKNLTHKKLSVSIIALSTALVITPILASTAAWGVVCPKGLTADLVVKAIKKHGGKIKTTSGEWKVDNNHTLFLLLKNHRISQGYTYTVNPTPSENSCSYVLGIEKKGDLSLEATFELLEKNKEITPTP